MPADTTVVVVSDGSALLGPAEVTANSLAVLLDDDAAGLQARAGVPVRAIPLTARDTDELVATLRDLPADTGAIFLTHTEPARARAAQQAVRAAGGPPVLTDADTITITLAAALLTTIARTGGQPATSRVIITEPSTLPELCALLIATGIGDISSWHVADAQAFPLHHLSRHATAVIDLRGPVSPLGGSSVLGLADPGYRLLPAPGLFAGLRRAPHATLELDLFRVCALVLAASTQTGRLVPELDDPHLTDALASAVCRATGAPRRGRE